MTGLATATIRHADSSAEIAAVRALFEAYQRSLDVSLCFQDFAAELASLPGDYARPRGALLLAWDDDTPVGCVALRPDAAPGTAELKRLYLRPAARGRGLGRRLALSALQEARIAGYREIVLDTLPSMHEAQRLYESLRFVRYAPARPVTDPPLVYLRLALDDRHG